FSGQGHLGPDAAIPLAEIAFADLAADEFLFFSWRDSEGRLLGENDYFPRPYKAYELPLPTVTGQWADRNDQPVLTLETDKPALFVTATVDAPGYFSDNALTLLPGTKVDLTFHPRHGATPTAADLAPSLRLRN